MKHILKYNEGNNNDLSFDEFIEIMNGLLIDYDYEYEFINQPSVNSILKYYECKITIDNIIISNNIPNADDPKMIDVESVFKSINNNIDSFKSLLNNLNRLLPAFKSYENYLEFHYGINEVNILSVYFDLKS